MEGKGYRFSVFHCPVIKFRHRLNSREIPRTLLTFTLSGARIPVWRWGTEAVLVVRRDTASPNRPGGTDFGGCKGSEMGLSMRGCTHCR